jgi:23S rRNA (cytosine1962-C5)-methyltransferase
MKTIRLREGKERSLQRRHPWIFDGAIARGGADSGETVRVESHEGQFLAWAAYSPASKIRARVWSFDESQRIDAAFLIAVCACSVRARARFDIQSDAMRLVHGESDGLPGLIVDRYGDTLVAQFLSAGAERWKGVLADAMLAATGLSKLYERSDASSRALEGLPELKGWLRNAPTLVASRTALDRPMPEATALRAVPSRAGGTGAAALSPEGANSPRGGPSGNFAAAPVASLPTTELVLQEHGWKLALNIADGHKTGFYLDQRDSRQKFADYSRRLGFKKILNCFCYTGGFTVAALAGLRAGGFKEGASHITSIDSSGPALEKAAHNVALNGFDAAQTTFMDADVNASLRQFAADGKTFDAIVLDPPKFAPTSAHAERAARAYKDINRLAFKILEPGGVLFTYSCSGGISADLFHKIVASAGADAGVDGFISERMGGAPDHPMTIAFPEGEYLKGLIVMRKPV